MYLYLISGRIGSGKTTFADYLREKGECVIKIDDLTHLIYKDLELKGTLMSILGSNIYDINGNPKPMVGNAIVTNPELFKLVESIIGPKQIKILKEILKNLERYVKNNRVFLECGYPQKIIPYIVEFRYPIFYVLIDKDPELRKKFVKQRWIERHFNLFNEEELEQKSNKYVIATEELQKDFEFNIINFKITNNGTIDELYKSADLFLDSLK